MPRWVAFTVCAGHLQRLIKVKTTCRHAALRYSMIEPKTAVLNMGMGSAATAHLDT